MASAIRMGLRRAVGKDAEAHTQSVLDAIEMAMELEASMTGPAPPISRPAPSPVLDSTAMAPPPNPAAVEEFSPVEVVVEPEAERAPIRPPLAQTPPPPGVEKNLVVLASKDSDIDRAVKDSRQATPLRVRSVFMRNGSPKIKLEDVMGWVVTNFPLRISIVPAGMETEVTLERKVYSIPCTVEAKESVAKVSYNHMKMDSRGEVGIGIRVGDVIENGYPVMGDILQNIKAQAVEMYKARPAMIEGKAPTGPDLFGSHRQMSTAIHDPRKRATAPPMKFADADDPPMFPDNK